MSWESPFRVYEKVWEMDYPDNEKVFLLAMARYANPDGTNMFPGVGTIARILKKSHRMIQRYFRKFEKLEVLVTSGKGPGGCIAYRFDFSKANYLPPAGGRHNSVTPRRPTGGDIMVSPPGEKRGDIMVSPLEPERFPQGVTWGRHHDVTGGVTQSHKRTAPILMHDHEEHDHVDMTSSHAVENFPAEGPEASQDPEKTAACDQILNHFRQLGGRARPTDQDREDAGEIFELGLSIFSPKADQPVPVGELLVLMDEISRKKMAGDLRKGKPSEPPGSMSYYRSALVELNTLVVDSVFPLWQAHLGGDPLALDSKIVSCTKQVIETWSGSNGATRGALTRDRIQKHGARR